MVVRYSAAQEGLQATWKRITQLINLSKSITTPRVGQERELSPRLVIILLAILVTFIGVGGAFLWGVFAGVRAVLGVLFRLGIILILVVLVLAFLLMKQGKR